MLAGVAVHFGTRSQDSMTSKKSHWVGEFKSYAVWTLKDEMDEYVRRLNHDTTTIRNAPIYILTNTE